MKHALLIYDSTFGHTEQIARAIAEELGPHYAVHVTRAAEAGPLTANAVDLLVVGGPTQRRHLSPQLRALMKTLPRKALRGVRAVTFDTRYRMTRFLTGSAARDAARTLARAGCHLLAPAESFFMEKDVPPQGEKRRHRLEHLEAGELDRARAWARTLVAENGAPS